MRVSPVCGIVMIRRRLSTQTTERYHEMHSPTHDNDKRETDKIMRKLVGMKWWYWYYNYERMLEVGCYNS
jgi:heme/copper-type cytochrome/quinol oxidase subunit 2